MKAPKWPAAMDYHGTPLVLGVQREFTAAFTRTKVSRGKSSEHQRLKYQLFLRLPEATYGTQPMTLG